MKYTASRICKFLLTISTLTACGVQSPHVSNQASPTYNLPAVITTVVPSYTPSTPETPTPTPDLLATSQAVEATMQVMSATKSAQETQTAQANIFTQETQTAQENMEAQINAWYQEAGVSIVEDERILNNTPDSKLFFSENLFNYMRISRFDAGGKTQQAFFDHLWGRLAKLMFVVGIKEEVKEFENDETFYIALTTNDASNVDVFNDFGKSVRNKLRTTDWSLPIIGIANNGENISSRVKNIEIQMVSFNEWEKLLSKAQEKNIPYLHRWAINGIWGNPNQITFSGGFIYVKNDTLVCVAFNKHSNVYPRWASNDNNDKFLALLTTSNSALLGILNSLALPNLPNPEKNYGLTTESFWSLTDRCQILFSESECAAEIQNTFIK